LLADWTHLKKGQAAHLWTIKQLFGFQAKIESPPADDGFLMSHPGAFRHFRLQVFF